jgi:hypothetical protein
MLIPAILSGETRRGWGLKLLQVRWLLYREVAGRHPQLVSSWRAVRGKPRQQVDY